MGRLRGKPKASRGDVHRPLRRSGGTKSRHAFLVLCWFWRCVVCHAIPRFLYELEFFRVDGFTVVLWFDFNGLFDVQEIVHAAFVFLFLPSCYTFAEFIGITSLSRDTRSVSQFLLELLYLSLFLFHFLPLSVVGKWRIKRENFFGLFSAIFFLTSFFLPGLLFSTWQP